MFYSCFPLVWSWNFPFNLSALVTKHYLDSIYLGSIFPWWRYLGEISRHTHRCLQGCLAKNPDDCEGSAVWVTCCIPYFWRFQSYFQCCAFWCLMVSKKFVNYLNCLPNGLLNNVNWSKFLSLTACLIWGPRKIPSLILDLVMWQFLPQKFKCLSVMVHTLTKFIIIPSMINIKGKNIFFGCSSVSSDVLLWLCPVYIKAVEFGKTKQHANKESCGSPISTDIPIVYIICCGGGVSCCHVILSFE